MSVGEVFSIPRKQDLDVEWRIKDFFSLKDLFYHSPEFYFNGESWMLGIYPTGFSRDNSVAYIKLRLATLRRSDSSISFEYSFSLKTLNEEKYQEKHCNGVFDDWNRLHETTRTYRIYYSFVELSDFISREELWNRRSQLLPSGVLTVVCSLKGPRSFESANSEKIINISKTHEDRKCKENSNEKYLKRRKTVHVLSDDSDDEAEDISLPQEASETNNSPRVADDRKSRKDTETEVSKRRKIIYNVSDDELEDTSVSEEVSGDNVIHSAKTSGFVESEIVGVKIDFKASSSSQIGAAETKELTDVKRSPSAEVLTADIAEGVKFHNAETLDFKQNASAETNESDNGSLSQDFKKMWLEGLNHDLILLVRSKQFLVHQDVLRARSPVFKTKLSPVPVGERRSLLLHGCDPLAMEEFLCYIYTGKVEILDQSNMLELYYIANKYAVTGLKNDCFNFIKMSMSHENICKVILFALKHNNSTLYEIATSYFFNNAANIMRTVEWQSFFKDNFTVANELIIKYVENKK